MKKLFCVSFSSTKGIFTHILLNIFDVVNKGYQVGVVFESEATKLILEYENKDYKKCFLKTGVT